MTKVNIESKSALAKLMATENIHVEHKQVPTASFDVKNRVLALPMWDNMDDVTYEGLIGHEVGHALYTPYEPWAEFVKENPSLKDCANVIEDARIERLMKIKYPGMRGTFFSMYEKLNAKDFFGVKGADLETYNIIDRINLHFKLGAIAGIPFNDAEKVFVEKVAKAETFEDVLSLTNELSDMAKDEAEANYEDGLDFSDADDVDGDFEMIEMPPMPNNGDADEESDDDTETNGDGGEETDSDEDGNEESETPTAGNKASETDDEIDGPEVEVPSYSDGAGGEGDVPPPSSETQRNFDSSLQGLNNVDAKEPFYVDLPKINADDVIIGYKNVISQLSEFYADPENTRDYWYDNDLKPQIMEELRSWKKDTLPVVNYMVKEFEMKQAASAHRRSSTGKTGQLDMNKLHAYKIDEDIFKRLTTVKDGKNHGLVMYVDWSGSMHGKMFATIKQTMTLVMFAKKVGIPFRVYSFTNGMRRSEDMKPLSIPEEQSLDRTLILNAVAFHEYFSDKMSTKEFNKQIENLFILGKAIEGRAMRTPYSYNLASTPLNEAIVASYDMVASFRKETGREKINVIFLTDGASDGNGRSYYDKAVGEPSWVSYNKEMYLRDPLTKKVICTRSSNGYGLTADLLKNLGDRCGVNVIGFYITSTREIRQNIDYVAMTWNERDNNRKYLTKNGYIGMSQFGYDKYFMVKDNALDQNAEFADVDRNSDGSVAKGKLRTQFRKFTKSRKVNKMMLNEFVAMVA